MKKLILVLLCLGALTWGGYQVVPIFKPLFMTEDLSKQEDELAKQEQNKIPVQTPTPAAASVPLRSLDVDAMAARMKNYQDVYKKLRDDSLAVYAKRHPVANPHDKEAATVIRLSAYLWVWDDFYEEGLWQTLGQYVLRIRMGPPNPTLDDPLITIMDEIQYHSNRYCLNDSAIEKLQKEVEVLNSSDYPEVYKFWGYYFMVRSIADSKSHPELKQTMEKSFALLPAMCDRTAEHFALLIGQHLPDDMLFVKAGKCLDATEQDADMLPYMAASLDKAFQAKAPESEVKAALEGSYYVTYAWSARGSGWANTVTPEGWKLMAERLLKASEILQAASDIHPKSGMIARTMIRVELGQGLNKDRMEKWFQAAVNADPDDYRAYDRKLYYLLPRWHGSNEEIWKFGLECMKTQNWSAKIPLILVKAVEDFEQENPKIYENAQIWAPLELVFESYLQHYPESTIYRSRLVRCAALGGHWEIAKKQLALLGNDWSRDVFSDGEYAAIKNAAQQHAKGN